jgi:hypothetical protein
MVPKRSKHQTEAYSIFVWIVVSALLLASCSTPATVAPPPATPTPIPPSPTSPPLLDTPTPFIGSSTEVAPLDTPTAILANPTAELVPNVVTPVVSDTGILPTPTLAPISVPISGSIVFPAGATATVVQATLQPGQVVKYTLQAAQSQAMTLIMDSPNHDITLGVFEPDGTVLLNPANRWTNWQGVLPRTELYTIQVTGGAVTETFALTIKIPQIVNFASGTTSATLNGITAYGYLFSYALYASAGQTLTANLNVPTSTAYLGIYGINTGTLLNDSTRLNTWTGVLPGTQYYVIEVIPNNGQVVNYSLTVSVTGAAGAAAPQTGDVVIKPGSTAAVKHGTVGPGQVVSYTVQASQYQPMILNVGTVDSTRNNVYLGVLFPDGSTFLSSSKKYLNWQWRMPETGLYTVQVFGSTTTEKYELTIKLPRWVHFPSGTSSVTIKSATEQGFLVSYWLYGNDGQTMTVSLNVPSSTAYLDVFGLETGSLLSYKNKANSWTGVLPKTQQYIVEVIPRGGWTVGYSVTISLH